MEQSLICALHSISLKKQSADAFLWLTHDKMKPSTQLGQIV